MEFGDGMIEVNTHVTYDLYRNYHMFCLFRKKNYKSRPIVFFIVDILGILFFVLFGIFFGFNLGAIELIVFLSAILLLMIFAMYISPKLYYKSARKLLESETKYSFAEEYMVIESNSELTNGSTKINYDALHKVYEVDDMILIFISNTQAYIIPKKDLSPENIQELRRILKGKVKKYKEYLKRKKRI